MPRACNNRSFSTIHFSTQNQDMCHDTIGYGMIKIQSQPGQKLVSTSSKFWYPLDCRWGFDWESTLLL
jgi:hypothetical protein